MVSKDYIVPALHFPRFDSESILPMSLARVVSWHLVQLK